MRPYRRDTAGFTLIEVLVAISILALLMMCAFESVRFGTRAWSAVTSRTSDADEVWTAQHFLRSRLEQLYPFIPPARLSRHAFAVEGEPTQVVFSAPLAAGHGLYRLKVFVRRSDGSSDLWAAWRLDRNGAAATQDGEDWQEEKLLSQVGEVRWSYLETSEHRAPVWLTDWNGRAATPALVRLRVVRSGERLTSWPEMVVRPRITADANCEFDLVARRCRAST